MLQTLPRRVVVALLALSVFFPIGLVLYQSILSGPFFMPAAGLSLESYAFIFDDPDFWSATRNTFAVAIGMSVIAIPLGAILAFIMVRTDLPGRKWLETPIMIPIFVSPVVLGFGYVVSLGPVGFFSVWFESLFGSVPWNIYSLASIIVIAGLTHVPHVYLYSSSALRNLGSDVEEAARLTGASPFRVARDVSIPMVSPALLYVGVLVFFLGFEIFGLPLILGDPEGHLVLTTYLYKLTNKLGTPSYHLMAAVATCIIAVTFPLVLLQRFLLKVLTLDHFHAVFEESTMIRSIINSILIGTLGGAVAVGGYLLIGLATHRQSYGLSRFVDYVVLTPRAVPGLM